MYQKRGVKVAQKLILGFFAIILALDLYHTKEKR
jgi:hypothetical protein